MLAERVEISAENAPAITKQAGAWTIGKSQVDGLIIRID
jgi:hypothetical protein